MPRPAGLSAEQRQAREDNLQEAERVARALRCTVQRPFDRPRSKVSLASVARDFGVPSASLSQRTRVGIVSDEEAEGKRIGMGGWFSRIGATQKKRQIREPSQVWHAAIQAFLLDFDSGADSKTLAHLIEAVSPATDVLRPSIFFEDSRPVGTFRHPDDWFRGAPVQNLDAIDWPVAMERWLVNFEQQTKPYIRDGQWRQLILDDIETCTQAFFDFAEKHRIFVTFPDSATTHLVLPLDGGLLNDLQSSYFFIAKSDPACRRGEPLDKVTFLRHLKCAHEEVFENHKSSDEISKGWRQQGLWPLNGEEYHEAFELPGAIRARGSRQRRRGEDWEIVRRFVWVEEDEELPPSPAEPSSPPPRHHASSSQPQLVSTSHHVSATPHPTTPLLRYTPYEAPRSRPPAQAPAPYVPYRHPLQPVQSGSNAPATHHQYQIHPPPQLKPSHGVTRHLPQLPSSTSTTSRAPSTENVNARVAVTGGTYITREQGGQTLTYYVPPR